MRVGQLVSRYQGSANLGGFLQAQVWKGSFLVCVGSYGVPSSMDDGVIHLRRNFPFYVCVPFDAPPVCPLHVHLNPIPEDSKPRDSRQFQIPFSWHRKSKKFKANYFSGRSMQMSMGAT